MQRHFGGGLQSGCSFCRRGAKEPRAPRNDIHETLLLCDICPSAPLWLIFLEDCSNFHRLAFLPPTGEIPGIWKTRALAGFHGLDAAGVYAVQEKAFAIGFVDDAQAGAVGVQAGAVADEVRLRHVDEGGDGRGLRCGDIDVPGPPAAVAATLALIIGLGFVKGRQRHDENFRSRTLRVRVHIAGMIRLLQRMDDTQPRHGEGGASTGAQTLRAVTVLADADESVETALDDWSRGLDWVQWLFSSIRHRQSGLYFHAADLPRPGLYPRAPITRQALAARWESFAQKDLRGSLGQPLIQAWQAARDQDLLLLLELDTTLDKLLGDRARIDSREAGARLLQGTRGARYQGLLGRYRSLQEEGKTTGHFFIVWAAVGHFFQLSLASVIAEYIRLEWDLAARHLPTPAGQLSAKNIASLTSHLMHLPTAGLHLLGEDDDKAAAEREA